MPALVIVEYRISTLLIGLLTIALGLAVVYFRPRDWVHRAFAFFLLMRGGAYFFAALSTSPTGTDVWAAYFQYFFLAVPFAAFGFAYLFRRAFSVRIKARGQSVWPLGVAAILGVAVLVWYGMDHRMEIAGHSLLHAAGTLSYVAYAAVGLMLASERGAMPDGQSRTSVGLLSIGFVAGAVVHPAMQVTGAMPYIFDNVFPLAAWLALLGYGVALGLAVATTAVFWRQGVGLAKTVGAVVGLGILSGVGLQFIGWNFSDVAFRFFKHAVESVWLAALVFLGAYALLRCKVFGIERQARRFVSAATVASPFAFVFFWAGETLEGWAVDTLGINSYVLGLAAAGIIGLGLFPLQRMAHRLAERLFPGVDGSGAYQARRREQMYRAAVEEAVSDRVITDRERLLLNEVRSHLNLSAKEARGLEKAVMASVMAALPS